MPTAGKLAAGVLFAALFWYISTLAIAHYNADEDTSVPWAFMILNTALGLVLGWRIAGWRAGQGSWMGAVSYGLTAGVAIALCGLFLSSFIRMVQLSLRKAYDGPAEAVIDVFALMFKNAMVIGGQDVLVTLVAGSVLAGLVTEWFGRNFR